MGDGHHDNRAPSPFIVRVAPLVRSGGRVLDMAAGGGRHTRVFLERGCRVVAVDNNTDALHALNTPRMSDDLRIQRWDLEDPHAPLCGDGGYLSGEMFDAVVVVDYLHRPLLKPLLAHVNVGGWLFYETFRVGNEQYARPRNPDHLLHACELLDLALAARMRVVLFEDALPETLTNGTPCVKQRLAAERV